MDARNRTSAISAAVLLSVMAAFLLLGGCLDPNVGPALHRPEAPPAPSSPETAVVQSQRDGPPPGTEESELVGQRVRSYIEQVDSISERARRDGATTARPADPATRQPARQASLPLSVPSLDSPGPTGGTPAPQALAGGRPVPQVQTGRTSGSPADAPSADASQAASPPRAESGVAPASSGAGPATAPPVLAAVVARGQAGIAVPEMPSSSEAPCPNAPAVASRAPISLAQFLQQWTGDADDSSFRQQLDLRILRAIAGDYEAARQPFSAVSTEQQAMGARLIDSLIAIRQAHDGDAAEATAAVLANIDELRDALRPLVELRIPAMVLCQEVRGFGDYMPIEPPSFPAGVPSEFVIYCEVQNFASRLEEDKLFHARFEMRTTVLNRGGDSVLELRDTDVVDSCRHRRNDCFIPRLVHLPGTLSPGEYVAKVTLIDKLGEKLAESRASFRVVAR